MMTPASEKLTAFLEAQGRSQRKFAIETHIPQQTLSQYARGLARPSEHRRRVIALATAGAVPEADWLTDAEREQLTQAASVGAALLPAA